MDYILKSYHNWSLISSITIWRLDVFNLRDYISEDSSASRNQTQALKIWVIFLLFWNLIYSKEHMKQRLFYVVFEVLMALAVKIMVIWIVLLKRRAQKSLYFIMISNFKEILAL